MSNHNYSQYSNKKRDTNRDQRSKQHNAEAKKTSPKVKMDTTPVVEKPKVELVKETVETVTLPDTAKGMVVDCVKLNVRENATVNSGIVCVLDVMSEVEVDMRKSTDKWAYVYTAAGAEGYCMRQYIEVRV